MREKKKKIFRVLSEWHFDYSNIVSVTFKIIAIFQGWNQYFSKFGAHLSLREWALACSLRFCLSQSRRTLSSSHWRFLRSLSRSFSLSLGRACFPPVLVKNHESQTRNIWMQNVSNSVLKEHSLTSFSRVTAMTSFIFSLLLLSVVRFVLPSYLLWRLDSQGFIFLSSARNIWKTLFL